MSPVTEFRSRNLLASGVVAEVCSHEHSHRCLFAAAFVACFVFSSSFQAQTARAPALPVGQPVTLKAPWDFGRCRFRATTRRPATRSPWAAGSITIRCFRVMAPSLVPRAMRRSLLSGIPVHSLWVLEGKPANAMVVDCDQFCVQRFRFLGRTVAVSRGPGKGPDCQPGGNGPFPGRSCHAPPGGCQVCRLVQEGVGTDRITIDTVAKSIASFERTVIAGNSPFDRYYFGHDKSALSPAAKRGFRLFTDPKKGNCAVCHTIGKTDALFTDNKFHNLGIGADTRGNLNDPGRYTVTKDDKDMGMLEDAHPSQPGEPRPTMHDGSFPTVKDALAHYIGGGNMNDHLDKETMRSTF